MIKIKNRLTGAVILELESLRGADLTSADLRGAYLESTDLRGAYLTGTDLRSADLTGAYLTGAILTDADLRSADLTGAILRSADLTGAILTDADLRSADLTGAKNIIQWQSPLGIKRICYSVKHDECVMHQLGCFWGDTEQALTAIIGKYGSASLYERMLLLNEESLQANDSKG